jgi:hypothetical protein
VIRWREEKHEYHLVRGANHLGRTLGPRAEEALQFLGRVIDPPRPDPVADDLNQVIAKWKIEFEEQKNHAGR